MALLLGMAFSAQAQFHTLKIPAPSNQVLETQRLAVTDITIAYGSPSARQRSVWSDTNIIPQNGNPIAWRAGANMNTTIEFSTDVMIEGKSLAAGKYGFHVIPKGDTYTLLFAHNNDQWGSYYLDTENDITLQVDVKLADCDYSEKLDYEFIDWSENQVTIALEWANKRLPFKVSVDLNKTVAESFRSELRGINTYHWQAWNDAALWCLNHDTNLEEALSWANRSINGGYGGFAANRNMTNMSTRVEILKKIGGRQADIITTVDEMTKMPLAQNEIGQLFVMLMRLDKAAQGVALCTKALAQYPDDFVLYINRGVGHYYSGNAKKGVKDIEKAMVLAPEQYKTRMLEVAAAMKAGTYKYPNLN